MTFYIIRVRNLHCASLGRRGDYILRPSHQHTIRPFNCRHLLCSFVPDQGKAEGDALESSATYTELQPKLAVIGCIHTIVLCLQSAAHRGKPFSHNSLGVRERDTLGGKLPGILQDTQRNLDTITFIGSLPFPLRLIIWGQVQLFEIMGDYVEW